MARTHLQARGARGLLLATAHEGAANIALPRGEADLARGHVVPAKSTCACPTTESGEVAASA